MKRARLLFYLLTAISVGSFSGVVTFLQPFRQPSTGRRHPHTESFNSDVPLERLPRHLSQHPPSPPSPPPPPSPPFGNDTEPHDGAHIAPSPSAREAASQKYPNPDDQHLFQTALSSLPDPTRISTRPKIAFLFMTRGSLPLARLWSMFFSGHEGLFSIYVHSSQSPPTKLPPVFQGSVVPSKRVGWGEITVVDAERRIVANALLDTNNERFVLLSESCIPLFNFSFVYNYLFATNLSFVRVISDPHRVDRGRWNKKFLPLVPIRDWRKGSQWFAITREIATIIVRDTSYYPLFRDYCKPHCYSDEHYFPTMLTSLAAGQIANYSVTFTDWSQGGSHPAAFGRKRVSKALIERIRGKKTCQWGDQEPNFCYLFARKFLPDSVGSLMFLSSYIGF